MKAKGWEKIIIQANTDKKQMKLLAKLLEETDKAKQVLRVKGYGWTGLSLLETVEQIEHNDMDELVIIQDGKIIDFDAGIKKMNHIIRNPQTWLGYVKPK